MKKTRKNLKEYRKFKGPSKRNTETLKENEYQLLPLVQSQQLTHFILIPPLLFLKLLIGKHNNIYTYKLFPRNFIPSLNKNYILKKFRINAHIID